MKRQRRLCSGWRSCTPGRTIERKCHGCNVWMCKNCMSICPSCNIPTTGEEMTIEYSEDEPCECFNNPRKSCFAIKCISCSVRHIRGTEWMCDCVSSTWKCSGCDQKICYECHFGGKKCDICISLLCCACNKRFMEWNISEKCYICRKNLCDYCIDWKLDDEGEAIPDAIYYCSKCNI